MNEKPIRLRFILFLTTLQLLCFVLVALYDGLYWVPLAILPLTYGVLNLHLEFSTASLFFLAAVMITCISVASVVALLSFSGDTHVIFREIPILFFMHVIAAILGLGLGSVVKKFKIYKARR
jgi:hypothetical protein